MASKVVRVQGVERLKRTMKAAGKELEDMREPTRIYADELARTARQLAPSRTGRLRSAIVVQGQQVIAGVRYALPVEYGSRRRGIPAARFMGRAIDETENDRQKIYNDGAADAVSGIRGA